MSHAYDIGGTGAKAAAVRALFVAVQQFVAGTDVSLKAAGRIEALLNELYPDVECLQEVVVRLARYRPGEKWWRWWSPGEREIRESLKGVESLLRRSLLPRRIERAANMSLIDLPDVFLELVKPDLSTDDDVDWYSFVEWRMHHY